MTEQHGLVMISAACAWCGDPAEAVCSGCGVYVCAEHCYEGECPHCLGCEDEPLDDHDVCPSRPGAFA